MNPLKKLFGRNTKTPPSLPRYLDATSPILKFGRWIKNIKEGHIHENGCSADSGGADGVICCTCGCGMVKIWDTSCAKCGDLSCYVHSWTHIIDGQANWLCSKCKMPDSINADSKEYSEQIEFRYPTWLIRARLTIYKSSKTEKFFSRKQIESSLTVTEKLQFKNEQTKLRRILTLKSALNMWPLKTFL